MGNLVPPIDDEGKAILCGLGVDSKPNGCPVVYRATSRAVAPVLPNFATKEEVAGRYEEKSLRSPNIDYTPRDAKNRFGYLVKGPKPGWVVFRVAAPGELKQLVAAARFNIRVPPPDGCDFHMDYSTDGGQAWKPLGKAEFPKDNEFSSGWMYGSVDVPSKVKNAMARVHVFGGGTLVGLMAAELYGVYQTPPPQAVKLTYAWKEAGTVKTHVENIAAGTVKQKFLVPTGKQILDEYIRLEVP